VHLRTSTRRLKLRNRHRHTPPPPPQPKLATTTGADDSRPVRSSPTTAFNLTTLRTPTTTAVHRCLASSASASSASSASSALRLPCRGAAAPRGARRARARTPLMAGRRPRPQQQEPRYRDTTPINEEISFEQMRVTRDVPGDADEMLGVMSKAEALAAARAADLDLVLIAAKSEPPVCKIVSYDKFRYTKEKKKKEQKAAASKGQELKELKMSYKIGEHDYEVRKKQAIRFLKQGNKVKFSMLFRGREITHSEVGQKIMLEMAGALDEIGVLDSAPKIMGRQMIMMISPKPTI